MKKLIIAALIVLCSVCTVSAKPHHTHHYRAYDRSITQQTGNRPADCYGIPWCGCWLRHVFGIADKTLNLAAAWTRYPRVDAHSANVVVWPNRHHVGRVLEVKGDQIQVISGNSGRGGVTTRWFKITRGFSFHRV